MKLKAKLKVKNNKIILKHKLKKWIYDLDWNCLNRGSKR